MSARVACLILALAIAASDCAIAQAVPNAVWLPGTYWTYRTDTIASGEGKHTQGVLTYVVLTEDASYGIHRWHLAVITEWFDGTEIVATATHASLLTLAPWRRWPQILNYLPPKHLPDFQISFRQAVAAQGLPWSSGITSMAVEMVQEGGWSERIVLVELADDEVTASQPAFDDAIPVGFEWTSRFEGDIPDTVQGLAWWSPSVGWWVRAEGQVRVYGALAQDFEMELIDRGVLSNDDMLLRLANALTSTAAIDPEYADGLRDMFERNGFYLPTE